MVRPIAPLIAALAALLSFADAGVRSIDERVRIAGGRAAVTSQPGAGTSVIARINGKIGRA